MSGIEVHGDADGGIVEKPTEEEPKPSGSAVESHQYEGHQHEEHEASDEEDSAGELDEECIMDEYSPAIYMAPHIRMAEQIKKMSPLVDVPMGLEILDTEYEKGRGYFDRRMALKEKYRRQRRVRADGNSLYRAFAFAVFEAMIQNRAFNDKMQEMAETSKDKLLEVGMEEFAVEDLHEQLMEIVKAIDEGMLEEELLRVMNDPFVSDSVVAYLRLVCSANLRTEHDYYSYVLKEGESMEEFCKKHMEPMGAPQEDIHVASLSNATGVGIRIEDLEPKRIVKFPDERERSGSVTKPKPIIEYKVPEPKDFPFKGVAPKVYLIQKPDHFDILYL